jgi:hypothetical protein
MATGTISFPLWSFFIPFLGERGGRLMEVRRVNFDVDSFGITQGSLKMLRDALAQGIAHPIKVVEVPTNDLCCGFFIFNRELGSAVWTGDGFRTDRAGEGGAGYRSAEVLFDLYGLKVISWEPLNIEEVYVLSEEKVSRLLLGLAQKIADEIDDGDFQLPLERTPGYVR